MRIRSVGSMLLLGVAFFAGAALAADTLSLAMP